MKHRRKKIVASIAICCISWMGSGCAQVDPEKRVVFLDGAGYFGGGPSVSRGLRMAGYDGEFRGFVWTSFLLWGADHLIAARSDLNANNLSGYIQRYYRDHPDGTLTVMGLSAGCSVILNALERLPDGCEVANVVLFQPSVSASRNLVPALGHIRGKLYATCSRKDALLAALGVNADGEPGPPAGRSGFRIASGLSAKQRRVYTKVVNLPWRSQYKKYGWNGGHVGSTNRKFVKHMIASRIMEPSRPSAPMRIGRETDQGETSQDRFNGEDDSQELPTAK